MESARKPQLSELRQKRLAYFGKIYPPCPPSEPKPSKISNGFVSKRATNHQVEQSQDKSHHEHVATDKTGAVPKSYQQQRSQSFGKSVQRPTISKQYHGASNGVGYRSVSGKNKSAGERRSGQELDNDVGNDVDEIFQLNRASGRSARDKRDKIGKVSVAETSKNGLGAASIDYEQHLINHLQRSEHNDINREINNNQRSKSTRQEQRLSVDSRKKHLKNFLYKQEEEVTPAVKAAYDHDAQYAENILQQMGQVRQLRSQVHGELMSGFSGQDFRLNPTQSGSDEEVSTWRVSRSETEDEHLVNHSNEEHHNLRNETSFSKSHITASDDAEWPVGSRSAYRGSSSQEDELEDSEKEGTFDLGALQDAAKQGDDILRRYIQSLSKNLKKKKQNESVLSSQSGLRSNEKKAEKVQLLENGISEENRTEEKRRDKQYANFLGNDRPERNMKSKLKEEGTYKPKVSRPTVTSVELESLGLFTDLTKKRLNSPPHESGTSPSVDNRPEPVLDQSGYVNGEDEEDNSDDDHLGLRTHRPQQRPLSPLKLISHRHTRGHEKQVYLQSLSDDEPAHLQQVHQFGLENGRIDEDNPSLSTQTDDVHIDRYQAVNGINSLRITDSDEARNNTDNLSADNPYNMQYNLTNQVQNIEETEDERKTKPPPSYEKLFSSQTDSTPIPHPSGTEVGNFVCSEQSTDSDAIDKDLSSNFPGEEALSNSKLKTQHGISTKTKSIRRPKTPERHVEGVREYHEQDRQTRRQLSSRRGKSREAGDGVWRQRGSGSQGEGKTVTSRTLKDMNGHRTPSGNEDASSYSDVFKVEDISKMTPDHHVYGKSQVGPAGDFMSQNQTKRLCLECNNLTASHMSECDVCGADILDAPAAHPEDLNVPPFDVHLASNGDGTERSHMTTGSAWDIKVTTLRQDGSRLRKGEDNETTVMGKIATFVPKLNNIGGDYKGQSSSMSHLEEEDGRGAASGPFGGLANRVDDWLQANETGRLSQELNLSESSAHGLPHPDQDDPNLLPNHPDNHQLSDEDKEIDQRVTFDIPAEADLNYRFLNKDAVQGEDEFVRMKPRPSSSGPQQSRQAATKPKSGMYKSKTGQLIGSPMFNRRWATSSSTWGSRRSQGDSLQLTGERSSMTASGSPVIQRKRPSSAKNKTSLLKSEAEPKVKGHRTRPQSASVKSRELKDFISSQLTSDEKESFLTVNSAQVEEGVASMALNSSHKILPLTLQLICDSPRGGDDVSIWELLPDEILLHIFAYLSFKDLIQCAVTCSRFHRIALDSSLWRTIRLHKRKLTDFSLSQIGERQPVHLSLTQCHGNIVTENGLRNLFRSCADTLQELNVSGCTGGDLTGDSLLLHASRCKYLTSLDASWCQATDNGLSAITESCQRLTTLCLNGCQSVSDESLNQVIKKHGKSLCVLEVLGCLQLSSATLHLIGNECRHLHTLNIGQCYKVTDESLSQMVHYLKDLKHLDLRGCKQIRDNCVRKIVRHCKRLRTLILANCTHITNAAIVEIATYLPTLRFLDVSGCKKINNDGVRSLATCCHYLTSLDASSTGVDHKSVSALANYCNKTLVSARFNCCKDITEAAVVKLLKNCKKLTSLHLYGVKGLRNLGVLKLQYSCLQFG